MNCHCARVDDGDSADPNSDGFASRISPFGAGRPTAARTVATFLTCAALLAGCATNVPRSRATAMSSPAIVDISAARARSNAAIAAHDTAAIAREWMPDIHVVASTGAQAAGADANVKSMAAAFARRPDTKWVRSTTRIRVLDAWNVASEEGEWTGTWTDPDGPVRVTGTYLAQWRNTNGAWRIQAEVFVPLVCEGGAYCVRHP